MRRNATRRHSSDEAYSFVDLVTVDGYQKATVGRSITLGADVITMANRRFKPIEILEAAECWWRLAKERGWDLRDLSGLRIRTDKTAMNISLKVIGKHDALMAANLHYLTIWAGEMHYVIVRIHKFWHKHLNA